MINKHHTVTALTIEKLDEEINKRISQSWQLHSNPYVFGSEICQAMVLMDEEESDVLPAHLDFENPSEETIASMKALYEQQVAQAQSR